MLAAGSFLIEWWWYQATVSQREFLEEESDSGEAEGSKRVLVLYGRRNLLTPDRCAGRRISQIIGYLAWT